MERFATITPTRDRPKLLSFCREQLSRQTIQPDLKVFIDVKPTDDQPDITKRIKQGIELVKREGIDIVYIVEDDDFYCKDYLERMQIGDNDFIGYQDTIYYHIKNRTWQGTTHPKHSSLFCTGFRISALDKLCWPADHVVFLDIKLWEYARDQWKKVKLMSHNPATGIKGHGIGKHGGKAHKWSMENKDPDMKYLRSRVEDYQFEFAQTL